MYVEVISSCARSRYQYGNAAYARVIQLRNHTLPLQSSRVSTFAVISKGTAPRPHVCVCLRRIGIVALSIYDDGLWKDYRPWIRRLLRKSKVVLDKLFISNSASAVLRCGHLDFGWLALLALLTKSRKPDPNPNFRKNKGIDQLKTDLLTMTNLAAKDLSHLIFPVKLMYI
jgi:hypothetical protein